MVVLIFGQSLLKNFQPQRQWCIKISLLWAQKIYTPLVLGRGSKCPWQFFPPAVVVYKILSPIENLPDSDSRLGWGSSGGIERLGVQNCIALGFDIKEIWGGVKG